MRNPPTNLHGQPLSIPPSPLPSKRFLMCHQLAWGRVLIYSCCRCPPPASLTLSTLALSLRHCLMSVSALASCLPLNHLAFTSPSGCCVPSQCTTSASHCTTVLHPLNAGLLPLPLIRAATSFCLCLP